MGIIVVMTVVVAASAAGVWFALTQNDDGAGRKPRGAEAVRQLPGDVVESVERVPSDLAGGQLLATYSAEKPPTNMSTSYPGLWLTKELLVRPFKEKNQSRLLAYELKKKTKKEAWKLDIPGRICAITQHLTVDGRTALLTTVDGPDGKRTCTNLVVVDLNRGKALWSKKIPTEFAADTASWDVTISQNTAAVSWAGGTAGYNLDSAKLLWSDTQASKCEVRGYAGGRQLIAVDTCEIAGTDRKDLRASKINPATGERLWTYSPGRYGHTGLQILSTQPIALGVSTTAGTGPSNVITLNDDGRKLSNITLNPELHRVDCPPAALGNLMMTTQEVEGCDGIVISNKYAFVKSQDEFSTDQPGNNIAAYSLKTGKGVARFDSALLSSLYVFQANGDNALAFVRGDTANPAIVYELRVKGEEEVPFMFFGGEDRVNPEEHFVLFKNGIFAAGDAVSAKGEFGTLVYASETMRLRTAR